MLHSQRAASKRNHKVEALDKDCSVYRIDGYAAVPDNQQ